MTARRGTLFLIVGPSGAGKDSLIAGAHGMLAGDPGFLFAQRVITRPAEAGGEPHVPATQDSFAAMRDAGGFMLHWRAHDTDYGIPVSCARALAQGCRVVANVSRTVIADAAAGFAPVMVVEIDAPAVLRAARLKARAREDGDGVASRLARHVALPEGVPVLRIDNAGTLEDGVAALLAAIRGGG